jgi:antirestriction protein ArdC
MSVYDEITQAIIAELEKGVPPIGPCALVYKN